MKYEHIVSLVRETPWAILPSKLAVITDLLAFRAAGGRLTDEEITARVGAVEAPAQGMVGQIAVLPLFGVLMQRADLMSEMSGATSVERFATTFRAAVDDSQVRAIVINIDSPGGSVFGIDELSALVAEARATKDVVAVANSLAASAAYWVAASASEVVVTPGGEVGSIGVLAAHIDESRANDAAGLTVSLVSAGKYKTEGNPFEPLGEEARGMLASRVGDYYTMMTNRIAAGRGVSGDAVRSGFGEGRVVGAKQAKSLGMADRVETLEATIDRLAARKQRLRRTAAGAVELERRRLALYGG